MAYTSGDTIEAAHYNGFVASVNALWGSGTNNRGIGQTTTISTVSATDTITATQWSTLLDRIRTISDHYGTDGSITIDTVSNPSGGDTIAALATLSADIGTIDAAQIAVAAVSAGYGSAITDTAVVSGTFTTTITQTDTLTFANANSMRYWFNAGGKVEVSWGVAGGTSDPKYDEWVDTASKCGTWQIFNTSSAKSGGSGATDTANANAGFWDLTTTPTVYFKQLADTCLLYTSDAADE